MTKEEVEMHFQKAIDVSKDWADIHPAIFTFFLIAVVFLAIGAFHLYKERDCLISEDFTWMLPGLFILVVTSIFYFMDVHGNQQEKIAKNIEEWKKVYAIPYINALPVEKRNVVFIKIEATSTQELKDHGMYLRTEEVHRTPITVSYKDMGAIVTKTDWYATDMGLSLDDKPYYQFTILPEPLGVREDGKKAEFWAGQYNQQIFMPNNYEFKEIK